VCYVHVCYVCLVNKTTQTSDCAAHINTYTGRTQKNGAALIVNTIKTAPFFCVCPVFKLSIIIIRLCSIEVYIKMY
jgi:hypothetical protein